MCNRQTTNNYDRTITTETYRNNLISHYGNETAGMFRKLEATYKKLAKVENHLTFVHKCKNFDLLPKFVRIKKSHFSKSKQKILIETEKKLLLATIRENSDRVVYLQSEIQLLEVNIKCIVDNSDYIKITNAALHSYNQVYNSTKQRQQIKLAKLKEEKSVNTRAQISNEQMNEKFVVNLSNHILTESEQSLLKKGLGFNVAPKFYSNLEIIASVESNVDSLPEEQRDFYKSNVVGALKKKSKTKCNLSTDEMNAIKTLRSDDAIIILPADKGRATVLMDKTDYDKKMIELLEGGQYTPIPKDPTNNIMIKVKAVLKDQSSHLISNIIRRLSPQFSKPPHIYGLPKLHKHGIPLRPIVSSINSPTYELSKFLLPKLKPLFGLENSYINNSTDFIEKIKGINVSTRDVMVSYDVSSLFTNIPVDELLDIVRSKLENDASLLERTNLPVSSIMELLRVCVNSSYFQFNSKFYLQKSGLPMGGVLSPILSNIYMDYFESLALRTWGIEPKIWLRYLDDIFCLWRPDTNHDDFLNHINNLRPTIKFTVEVEINNQLPFLDVLVKKEENGFRTSVYRKPTNTGQYLNFHSNSPNNVKMGIAQGLFFRAFKVSSDEEAKNKEIEIIKEELRNNNYPSYLINKALKKTKENIRKTNDFNRNEENPICTITVPYVKGKSEKIRRLNKKFNIRTVFSSGPTLRSFLTKVKPTNKDQDTKNVVYKIPCECGKSYYGQTSRPAQRRLKEHQKSIINHSETYSKLSEHIFSEEHRVQWAESTIIYQEANWKSRNLKEAACMVVDKSSISQPSATISPMFWPLIEEEVKRKIENGKTITN